jgi:hypothetical protein
MSIWSITKGHVDQADQDYEDHKRGKNWIATVEFDPSQPGSIDRSFWERGSGSYRSVPDNLQRGDLVEVAADYYTGSGRKNPSRSYLRVRKVVEGEEIYLDKVEKPDPDTLSAEEWREEYGGKPKTEYTLCLTLTTRESLTDKEKEGLVAVAENGGVIDCLRTKASIRKISASFR